VPGAEVDHIGDKREQEDDSFGSLPRSRLSSSCWYGVKAARRMCVKQATQQFYNFYCFPRLLPRRLQPRRGNCIREEVLELDQPRLLDVSPVQEMQEAV
jgi:hypothetical protein